MKFFEAKLILIALLVGLSPCLASAPAAASVQGEQDIAAAARSKVASVLQKYCGEACELINVDVEMSTSASVSNDLGFESISGDAQTQSTVGRVLIDIQVDDRVTTSDQERLGKLVVNSVRSLSATPTVRWSSVAFPQIGVSAEVEDRLKQNLQQRIQVAVQQTIDSYCSQECVLANVGVDGKLISPDESRGVPERELVRERGGRGTLRIQNVDIDLSIDEKLPETSRTKIYNLIKAKTKFAYPVNVNVAVVDFPESSSSSAQKDPWGLDRLRQTLQIFRDLAGTKEIITNSSQNNTTSNSSNTKEASAIDRHESKELRENSSLTSREKTSASEKSSVNSLAEKSSEVSASESSQTSQNTEYMIYIGAFLILAMIIAAVFMRFASASRDARIMMESMPGGAARGGSVSGNGSGYGAGYGAAGGGGEGSSPSAVGAGLQSGAVSHGALSLKMKIEFLREEMLRVFVDNPKIARDTFTRMLQEDGIDQTARYVHIFGPMIVFDLMNDPSLQRDLNDLSEFYYKSSFAFTDEQTLELLNGLKTKVTASEIRVMARKRTEQFDFLHNLDAPQIFALISEEKPHVQSIVLTQLDHSRRRTVFDMFVGDLRVSLMRELCKADAIPKEYLANVAKALHKKVLSRTEFDTEHLRSSDIIIDLLEKSTLLDQRMLMADLVMTNPEAARAIKLKLVTVEMLPYIRDGHLLEIVMGLERADLLTFLLGAPDHIRDLLLSKAPAELAQTWLEDLEQSSSIEEGRYRMAEMRILGRVRSLANNGAIRLLDINDRIFAPEHLAEVRRKATEVEMAISPNSVAA